MKAFQIANFENLSGEELISVNGGTGLSSLNPTITGLLSDLGATTELLLTGLNATLTGLTTNLDGALGTSGLGGLLGGGLLGGSGSGLLGGGLNIL